jgi:hypothetical protein
MSNKGKNITGTNSAPLVINISTNVFGNFTSTCNVVSAKFKVPTTGLKTTLIPSGTPAQPIQFSGCSDSLGGTDTIASTGTWHITFKDAANDETQAEPNSGDRAVLKTPLNGATLSSSIDPSCVLTLDTTATSKITMAYDDRGTGTIAAGTVPGTVTAGSGCPAGMTVSETLNADTLVLSTPIHDVS